MVKFTLTVVLCCRTEGTRHQMSYNPTYKNKYKYNLTLNDKSLRCCISNNYPLPWTQIHLLKNRMLVRRTKVKEASSCPRSKCGHHMRPNQFSLMQQAKIHHLFMLNSVMMAIEWSGHMCGSALYEFLMVTELGRGGFIHENRWAGKEGGSYQAEKALLGVSLC